MTMKTSKVLSKKAASAISGAIRAVPDRIEAVDRVVRHRSDKLPSQLIDTLAESSQALSKMEDYIKEHSKKTFVMLHTFSVMLMYPVVLDAYDRARNGNSGSSGLEEAFKEAEIQVAIEERYQKIIDEFANVLDGVKDIIGDMAFKSLNKDPVKWATLAALCVDVIKRLAPAAEVSSCREKFLEMFYQYKTLLLYVVVASILLTDKEAEE